MPKLTDALPDACDTAIQQINDRMYAADFRDDYDDILCYGIAFFKKRCMDTSEKMESYNDVFSDIVKASTQYVRMCLIKWKFVD